ncbi:hypothetical protein GQ43DRAFT_470439 [Delitschia confertaspora ATCC 74209]|uniref:Uncharacterized protein n=1 Tax=Delitschia confertaspora ATCC 74209 TaxID=1513339 RepID=A0A9P4MUE1_9PLEO|nr:hypothetical protein GQ43DRAFT_470439 [Delitschia confertaspora ATCC 74209]
MAKRAASLSSPHSAAKRGKGETTTASTVIADVTPLSNECPEEPPKLLEPGEDGYDAESPRSTPEKPMSEPCNDKTVEQDYPAHLVPSCYYSPEMFMTVSDTQTRYNYRPLVFVYHLTTSDFQVGTFIMCAPIKHLRAAFEVTRKHPSKGLQSDNCVLRKLPDSYMPAKKFVDRAKEIGATVEKTEYWSPDIVPMALILLHRIRDLDERPFAKKGVEKTLLVAIIVAEKLLTEYPNPLRFWSKLVHHPLRRLIKWDHGFISGFDFHIVRPSEYHFLNFAAQATNLHKWIVAQGGGEGIDIVKRRREKEEEEGRRLDEEYAAFLRGVAEEKMAKRRVSSEGIRVECYAREKREREGRKGEEYEKAWREWCGM